MDFDEANELFGRETLNGMQMVQVNGGWVWVIPPAVKAIAWGIGVVASLITIGATIKSCSGTDATPSSSSDTILYDHGDGYVSIKGNVHGFDFKQGVDSLGNSYTFIKIDSVKPTN